MLPEPIISLASSIVASPGIYSLLIGSGVSRSAAIPTGWEVALDLTERLAAAEGAHTGGNTEDWYRKRFGGEPDYSLILGALAATSAHRRDLLAPYFEATDADREQNLKVPTRAHRAIARLVSLGFLKVIVTTNFDRLLEQALEDESIRPTVISQPDHLRGAIPLQHAQCTVIKLHGDYLDQRLLNTSDELAKYPRQMNKLLDRVLDEYGLVVCGWSAEWDEALVEAFRRCPNRRYATYWCFRGDKVEPPAKRVIDARQAYQLQITDADSFFAELLDKVEALQAATAPHPSSTPVAIATLKRNLADTTRRIDVEELLRRETDNLLSRLEAQGTWPNNAPQYMERIEEVRALTQPLMALVATGVFYGTPQQDPVWVRTLTRVLNQPRSQDNTFTPDSDRYPAALLFYAAGIACVASNRLSLLFHLARTVERRSRDSDPDPAVHSLYWNRIVHYEVVKQNYRAANGQTFKLPINELLFRDLRDTFSELLPSDRDYEDAFDDCECFLALVRQYLGGDFQEAGVGRFSYKHEAWRGERKDARGPLARLTKQIEREGKDWEPLRTGSFGGSPEAVVQALGELWKQTDEAYNRLRF